MTSGIDLGTKLYSELQVTLSPQEVTAVCKVGAGIWEKEGDVGWGEGEQGKVPANESGAGLGQVACLRPQPAQRLQGERQQGTFSPEHGSPVGPDGMEQSTPPDWV